MQTFERRYDIDWLRVITIGLLLIYHVAIVFQPWGIFIGFIQSKETLPKLWIPMQMLNVWRIPILFFISGMGVGFALRKRSWKQLLVERTKRILIPLLFGVIAIVPLHIFILQNYYNLEVDYHAGLGHLWFLANIFIYVVVLLPLLLWFKNNVAIQKVFSFLYSKVWGVFIIVIPFVFETLIINPAPYELYAQTWHGFFLGLLAFFFGYTFLLCESTFKPTLRKWWWLYTIIAFGLYFTRLLLWELKAHNALMVAETLLWCLAILGFGQRFLSKQGKTLGYLSQGAYPVYIVHMVFLYFASAIILPLQINVLVKLLLITLLTFAGSVFSYEIIRRLVFLRPLFGLKVNKLNN